MTSRRDKENLRKLLQLNKLDLDQQQRRLADLQAAHASTQASLDWLAQSVRQEELKISQAAQPDLTAMQGFATGIDAKKATLEATMETLCVEIEEARGAVLHADQERQKLEHLLDRFLATAKKKAGKKEIETMNDLASRMAR